MRHLEPLVTVLTIGALVAACARTPAPPGEHAEGHDHDDGEAETVSLGAEAYATAGIAVTRVAPRSIVPVIEVTGTLAYDERRMAVATARIGGRITEVVADYGRAVSAGAVLAWIDSPELGAAQADYRRALGVVRLKQVEFQRAELLLQGQAISRGESLRREADWRAAEVDLQASEQKLHILGLSPSDIEALASDSDGTGHVYPVRAPIDGRVTERRAVPGRVVSADDELFTIADLRTLWLFLQVFEKDLPAVDPGAAVTLTCEAHPEERFSGRLDFVGQVLDPHSRTAKARAVIDNPNGELKPGMFVYARIDARGDDDAPGQQIAVPALAIVSLDARDVVFVQAAERTFEVRSIVIGRASGDWVEVRSGLVDGETIAVSGVFTLKSEVLKGGLAEHVH